MCVTHSGAAFPLIQFLGSKLPLSMRWWQEWPCSLSLLLRSRFGFALSSCFFFWRLCYCTESVSSIEIMIFSQIYISHEALLQQDPLFMQKDAPVVRAAVPTFRDVLWVLMLGTVVSPCLIPLCTEHFYISPWFWESKTPGRCSAVTLSAEERQNCQLGAGTGWKASQFLAGFS